MVYSHGMYEDKEKTERGLFYRDVVAGVILCAFVLFLGVIAYAVVASLVVAIYSAFA